MLYSQSLIKTQKLVPKDEASINAQLLLRASFIDKLMAGVYSLLPLGWITYKKIENIIREEMNAIGGQELFLPALHPKENWQTTGRWGSFDALIYVGLDEDKNMALGPTHEEIISPLAKKFIFSYKDLPKYAYQFQNKFRNEKRAKSGMMRLREFVMKDLYSFHADQADLDDYYEKVKQSYIRIFERCGIGDKTYVTYASGGTFCKYSHEFQTLTEAGEDIIYICDKCHVAVNREIIEDVGHKCPECGNPDLREEKAVEVGNIFKLGTKYSQPFDLKYLDKNGEKQEVIMGCYGIGPQRLMGAIVELKNDSRGIVWPENIAPFKAYLIEAKGQSAEAQAKVKSQCEELYGRLSGQGIEALYDDRENVSTGEKFADADLIGCTYRIVVSEKTLEKELYEVKRRDGGEVEFLDLEKILERLK